MKTTLAIDFGTTNSLVGAYHNDQKIFNLAIDPSAKDASMMRTLMYFPNPDLCYYGSEALNQYHDHEMEGRLFRSFKSHLPNKNYLGTVFDNRIITLENMVGLFLLELKKRSEKILNTQVDSVVFGRPARYSMDDVADGFAMFRMKKAAEFAGFKKIEFLPEPLAAALEFKKEINSEKIILIGDFGGGTSDFTIMKITTKEFEKRDVLAIEGCPLAGDVLDSLFMQNRLNQSFGANAIYKLPMSSNLLKMPNAVMDRLNKPAHIVHLKEKETYTFIKEVQKCTLADKEKNNIDRLFTLIEDQQIFSFFEKIESTKKDLSSSNTAQFHFDYPSLEIQDSFKQTDYETWASSFKENIFQSLGRAMSSAQLKPEQIDHVFLTGGTAHVPFIRSEFEKMFGSTKLESKKHFHSIVNGLVEFASQMN